MPVEAVHLAGEHAEVVAEGGVATELRLGGRDGDRSESGELLVQQLDAPTDAAKRGQAVERRADLVEQHLGAYPRDLRELCADQLIELLPAQGTRWAGDSDDVGVGRQWSVTAAHDEDRVKAITVRLSQDIGGAGEVVGDKTDRRHVSAPL